MFWRSVKHALFEEIDVRPGGSFLVRLIIETVNTGLADERLKRKSIDRRVPTQQVTEALLDPIDFSIDLVQAEHLQLLKIGRLFLKPL